MENWEKQMDKDGYPDTTVEEECGCCDCGGKGYYWVMSGPGECEKEVCECVLEGRHV